MYLSNPIWSVELYTYSMHGQAYIPAVTGNVIFSKCFIKLPGDASSICYFMEMLNKPTVIGYYEIKWLVIVEKVHGFHAWLTL